MLLNNPCVTAWNASTNNAIVSNIIQSLSVYKIGRNTPLLFGLYWLGSNFAYLSRRAQLRGESVGTMLKYRTQREPGVSPSLHATFILTWQLFVLVWPCLEIILGVFTKHCSLFYSYPNAKGLGFIVEPLSRQHLPLSKRTKFQIRLDWHQFSVNVGPIGRDGFRHPPSIQLNRPHIDAPKWGARHWPWRRRHSYSNVYKSNNEKSKK
mmetsp:Transcript_23210/g.34264  ORF Transcript_23210/g.34264 Transcript_23210/m.34264 type:complete len:208 (+) Transcript_23210:77-700(+)